MRNKADGLLTPIIKKMYPTCLLRAKNCTIQTQVAHHHVHKGASTRLRYELDNLIPLCNHCHLALHMQESEHASTIVAIRGVEWFRELQKKKQEYVKSDVHYYIQNYNRLKEIYEKEHRTI